MNAVEAQDVGSERAQARKDARIASDAAGVLGEATVTDVVGAILDVPVVTDGLGTLSRWQHDVADKQSVSLVSRHSPVVAERVSTSRLTRITARMWPSHSVSAKLSPGANTSTVRVSSRHRRFLSAVCVLSSGAAISHSAAMA